MAHGLSHPSGRATKKTIQRKFVWPTKAKDIAEWARTCLPCQRSKVSRHTKLSHKHINVPDVCFAHVHLDIIGPMQQSRGYQYYLTIIDWFTRWLEAVLINDIMAEIIADIFYTHWISRFGALATITTDQGS